MTTITTSTTEYQPKDQNNIITTKTTTTTTALQSQSNNNNHTATATQQQHDNDMTADWFLAPKSRKSNLVSKEIRDSWAVSLVSQRLTDRMNVLLIVMITLSLLLLPMHAKFQEKVHMATFDQGS